VKKKKAQIFGMAWLGDYPDAENFLQLFYSKNASPGANGANYNNPAFDALYEKARVMQPGPERTALYKEAAEIVVDDVPWIFRDHRKSFVLQQGWLKNYKPHDIASGIQKYYRVDVEARRSKVSALSNVPLLLLGLFILIPVALIVFRASKKE
ncbi:MAG: ABC transporter substrate-binding protein, partial [Planctomycetota bacterium]|jgi:ABC-type transport system substrate-binding protein